MNYKDISALITDEGNDLIYISDIDDYGLYYLNKTLLDGLGIVNEQDWKGKKCYEILQGKKEPCEFCTNHLLNRDSYYEWEYYNPLLQRYYSIKDKLINIDDNDVRLEVATDITTKQLLEQDIKLKYEEQKTLNECVEALHSNDELQVDMSNLLKILLKYFDATRAYIFEISKCGKFIDNTFEECIDGVTPQKDTLINIPIENASLWFEMFKDKGEFSIDSVQDTLEKGSHEYEILSRQNISSLVCSPLYDSSNEVTGFLGVDDPSSNSKNTALLHLVSKSISDYLEKNRLFNMLHELSFTDLLTGLKNRHSYRLKLSEYNLSEPSTLGVAYADISGMKEINDTKGHKAGDDVIVDLSKILNEIFKDHAYRVGGDEFVVLCENIDEKDFEDKISLLKKKVSEHELLKISLGFSWTKQGSNASKQVELADSLKYMEKQQQYGMEQKNSKYSSMLSQNLEREILERRFVVYLQPQIDLQTGQLASAEALIRRLDSSGQIQPPFSFIPFYEKEGIISKIDLFVFEEVCKVLSEWNKKGLFTSVNVAVNFSRITIAEKGTIEKLSEICEKYSVSPSRLIVEITEAIGYINQNLLSKLMKDFSKKGFSISLDDFGSGQSNLAILTNSSFDELKIDRSLIIDLENNVKSRTITKLAIDVCGQLDNLDSIAEGIETVGQFNILKDMKCKKGQGYYFCRPVPVEEFEQKYTK